MLQWVILASWLDWLLQWINLYIMIGNLVALGWGAIFIFSMFVLNAVWLWDEQAQKKRVDRSKSSAKYIALSLIIINVLFGAIHLLWLDAAGDSSNSTVSEFLQQWADQIDSWDYNMKLKDATDSDYKNTNWWDNLNFWQ